VPVKFALVSMTRARAKKPAMNRLAWALLCRF
jgi:hypothetical protein